MEMTNHIQEKLKEFDLENSTDFAEACAYLVSEKRGKKITIIDLRDKSIEADYFVICSASSTTQVRAIAEFVDDELCKIGYNIVHRDIDTKWSALDYSDVIVHVFYNEVRDYYQLERLWEDKDNVRIYEYEE